ncbi:MAG: hypothetical protein AB7G37_18145 [Solirubrobacteraceae bacterium]
MIDEPPDDHSGEAPDTADASGTEDVPGAADAPGTADASDTAGASDPAELPGAVDPTEGPLPPHLRVSPDDPAARSRSRSRLILLLFFGFIPMIVVFMVVLHSLWSGPPAVDDPTRGGSGSRLALVTRYCVYTAKDDDDYYDCLDRTDGRVVERDPSPAGRYARGELTRCLEDAGYRCTIR